MILVFLHGKGANEEAYGEQLKVLAENLSAQYVSLRAPFYCVEKKGKYLWFNKFLQNNRRDAVKEEYAQSLSYIKNEIQKLSYPLTDIVLIGHSQGGGMAVSVGLELKLKAVFSICGDLPYNLEYKNLSDTSIYWLEGADDVYIDEDRKKSYKMLTDVGADFNYMLVDNCTHTEIDNAFLEIEEILK